MCSSPARVRRVTYLCAGNPVADLDELRATFHLDPAGCERIRQHRLHIHLPHEGEMRERRVRERRLGQADMHHARAHMELSLRGDICPCQQLIRDAQRAQHLQRSGMHDERAGRSECLASPVDDAHVGTVGSGL